MLPTLPHPEEQYKSLAGPLLVQTAHPLAGLPVCLVATRNLELEATCALLLAWV